MFLDPISKGKGPKIVFPCTLGGLGGLRVHSHHIIDPPPPSPIYIVRPHAQLDPLLGNTNVSRPHSKGKSAKNSIFLHFGGPGGPMGTLQQPNQPPPFSVTYCEPLCQVGSLFNKKKGVCGNFIF